MNKHFDKIEWTAEDAENALEALRVAQVRGDNEYQTVQRILDSVSMRRTKRVWDGEYEKGHYILITPTGEEVVCWPNAGFMNSSDGSGRKWLPCPDILIYPISTAEAISRHRRENAGDGL